MCGHKRFKKVINFGRNALVNSLVEDITKKEKTYPLVVRQCQNCGLVQITDPIDSNKIYRNEDYLYFSGDMPNLSNYFGEYAQDLKDRFLDKGDLVVEIGSNDGTMLEYFKKEYRALGVDPASNVVVRALKRGVATISDFFSERLAKSIVREIGKAKLIYGNNCIAHLDNLHDLMAGVKVLLDDKGVFAVECNYWGSMVENKNYSLIYHDHFSYFTLINWIQFLKGYDMEVFDAVITSAQGGSLRLFASLQGKYEATERFKKLMTEELSSNLNSYDTCKKYKKEVLEEAQKLGDLVRGLKKQGKKIAGYGAAAKGFSVLKLAKINEKQIDYFVDDSPAKQGKYTPISHIPVISREEAEKQLPDYFFITASNYTDVIIKKEQKFHDNGGKFITAKSEII